MNLSRRSFGLGLTSTAFASLAISGCGRSSSAFAAPSVKAYGALVEDPQRLLDLPKGFSYRVISALGDPMDDGYRVPDRADGMGSFDLGGGKMALVRNHEVNLKDLAKMPWGAGQLGPDRVYDRAKSGMALAGGTTTLVLDARSGKIEQQYWSLAGTIRNCSGGITPWGSWLSCEEDKTRAGDLVGLDHGWVFEVPAAHKGLVDPVPLKAMGRFNHEAAAIDVKTGIAYLTEDEENGVFYRLLPNAKGDLAKGGTLQVLGLKQSPATSDMRNWASKDHKVGKKRDVFWFDVDGADNPGNDLRMRMAAKGATLFARGEGIYCGKDELFFACTSGGSAKSGQIMRYRPSRFEGQKTEKDEPGTVEIFFESVGFEQSDYADNLVIAPNGHIIFCEDQGGKDRPVDNHLRGLTPKGELYPLARLRTSTELAGACFSPDGSTMFVNLYQPAKTLAISGPWGQFLR
jgi:uncharacterized protein